MDNFERWYDQDLTKPILLRYDRSLVFTGDNESVTVGVHVTNNGEPAALAGTVSGAVIRSNGTTVPLTGTLSDSDVSVVLTSACVNVPGPIGVALTVTSGDQKVTVLKVVFPVEQTSTDNVVDPSSEITLEVADLIGDIETAIASIPANYSDLLATIAPTFSDSTAYASGAYVWYNGTLYRFTAAHAAGSWTGTDAVTVVIGSELSDLKSGIEQIEPGLSEEAKAALLNCFRHVAFIDANADYYGALENALYATDYPIIRAVFNSGTNKIYTDDALDTLKQYLTVTYYETEESAGTVISSQNYILSGVLVEGVNSITAVYNGLTAVFNVTAVNFYNQYAWDNLAIENGNASNSGNIGIGVNLSAGALRNNRFAYVLKGLKPFEKTQDHTLTTYYPIPIPYEATGMTCNISPAERYLACYIVKYNRDTELYTTVQPAAWTQGAVTYTFNADSDQFLVVSSKYDAATSEYIGTPEISVQYTR